MTLTIARTIAGTSVSSVQYATVNGTAVAGTSFTGATGIITWAAGDSSAKTLTIDTLSSAAPGQTFSVALSMPSGVTLGTAATAAVVIGSAAPPTAPLGMKLISRGVPSYASSGTASWANDSNYSTQWRSSGVPATLSYDLSSIDSSDRQTILIAWYNDTTYAYDHAWYDVVAYNNAGSYTIEANASPGGGAPPSTGWVVLATVSQNTLHSKQHVLTFAGYNWIRMNATVSDGSNQNEDIQLNMDVYDASKTTDGWFFGGDSITANCMGHGNTGSVVSDSFGDQVYALVGVNPPQENGGMPGWTSGSWIGYLPNWLAAFPGKYVTLNLGSNDAYTNGDASAFYSNMATLIGDVIAAGKIPVVPTIPWSRNATLAANVPLLNAQVRNLYSNFPKVLPGPDLYSFYENNQNLISSDDVHPTDAGCAAMRANWASTAAKAY